MTNQVTSIEQSKRLLKLGVPAEKASMKWERYLYCTDQHGEEPITVWDDWSLEIGSISMDAIITKTYRPSRLRTCWRCCRIKYHA